MSSSDVIRETRIVQPSSMIQVSRQNPDAFIHKALDIVKTGFGQPLRLQYRS
ncbi:MAG: hypothetical protein U5L72_09735 [Bacteroidales bacterium]|nr:hypothetical protein [Bacteroidales bacterium]